MTSRTIAVVGGGFAGTALAGALEGRLPDGWQVVLLSDENYMTYNPLLPEVAGASLPPAHAVAPIRRMLPQTRFHRVRVAGFDFAGKRVCYDRPLAGAVAYDHLVLACGRSANDALCPGMAEHAVAVKRLGDALEIRNRILRTLERAELEDDPERRPALLHFVVLGGGFSGVEVAGAMADFLHAARRQYPVLQREGARVTIIDSGDRLLHEFPGRLGARARRDLERRGIEVRLGRRVARVDEQGLELEDGDRLAAATVAACTGTTPTLLVQQSGLPLAGGRIRTGPDMAVDGREGVWALGDCAAVPNAAEEGATSPPTAQFAVRQARALADNLARRIAGQPTRPFRYRSRGQVAAIGHRKAVAQVFGVPVTGFAAWLIWRGLYLLKLPTLLRKVEVFFEWNWELLFSRDVSQLHFARSGEEEQGLESGGGCPEGERAAAGRDRTEAPRLSGRER